MELLKQIESEGERRVQEVLREAERHAQEILAQAEREIAQERERALQELEAQLDQERRAALSRARAQARAEYLKAKSALAQEVFEKLSHELAHLRADATRYRKFLELLLQEAERSLPGPLVVRVAPEDQKLMAELLKSTPHKLGEPIATQGGLMATTAQGDLVVDNRWETRITSLRTLYRAELGRALFDRARPD
ncbi:MAG: V-type ATP synthase subunit E [Candidatus Bipolaricaulota bacterium]|nr:V-type ATP synthase subunit E [Candidatus Bipolaricaulota bacterium]